MMVVVCRRRRRRRYTGRPGLRVHQWRLLGATENSTTITITTGWYINIIAVSDAARPPIFELEMCVHAYCVRWNVGKLESYVLHFCGSESVGRTRTLLVVYYNIMYSEYVEKKFYTVRTIRGVGWRFGVCEPYARGTWTRGRRARSASVGRGIPWRPSRITRVRVTHVGTIGPGARDTTTTTTATAESRTPRPTRSTPCCGWY